MKVLIERHLGQVWTSIPVKVIEDTKEGHIVKLQPTVKAWAQGDDGKLAAVEMTHLGGEVPIQFAAGGGFTITHPVKAGDEGIAVFAARCIDGWWDKGDVQAEPYRRRHSLSDAMYVPGIRSKPRKLGGNGVTPQDGQQTAAVSLGTLQIRTDKGDVYVEITSDSVNIVATQKVTVKCVEMDVTATSRVTITSPLVTMSGDLEVGGRITAGSQISAGADVHAAGDVHAGDSEGTVSLSWTQTGTTRDATTPVAGILSVVSHLPTNVSTIGDNFSISGAISMAENVIPGGSALLNQAHQVLSIVNSQNFTAALSALPGQIGQIAGNPTVKAIVRLLGHDHHGVRAGPDISAQPVTGT